MSTTAEVSANVDAKPERRGFGHDMIYLKIAAVLTVLTAIEIALPAVFEGKGKIYGPMLIVLMLLKFWLVASFFMHLRFDNPMLKRLFTAGIIIAVVVYMAALSSMLFWHSSGTTKLNYPSPSIIPVTTAAPAAG